MKRAYYSAQATEAGHGTSIWLMADGTEKEITCVLDDAQDFGWPDGVDLGEAVRWVRGGKLSREVDLNPPCYTPWVR